MSSIIQHARTRYVVLFLLYSSNAEYVDCLSRDGLRRAPGHRALPKSTLLAFILRPAMSLCSSSGSSSLTAVISRVQRLLRDGEIPRFVVLLIVGSVFAKKQTFRGPR